MDNKIKYKGEIYVLEESRRIDRELDSGSTSGKVNRNGSPYTKTYTTNNTDNVNNNFKDSKGDLVFNKPVKYSDLNDPNHKSSQHIRNKLNSNNYQKELINIIDTIENNFDLEANNKLSNAARELLWELNKPDAYKFLKRYIDNRSSTGVDSNSRKLMP